MIFGLLPVKAPGGAKLRLRDILTPPQREALARCMFEEALARLLEVRGLDRVVVASSDAAVLRHAEAAGAAILPEAAQKGHSDSADRAARQCMEWGATTVAFVPIDVPMLQAVEIEEIMATAKAVPAPSLVIVPSLDGTGTNAMVRTPPDLIESRFGPGSFRAHVEQAEAKGAQVIVVRPAGLVFDLDTPGDVRLLFEKDPEGKITGLLRRQLS